MSSLPFLPSWDSMGHHRSSCLMQIFRSLTCLSLYCICLGKPWTWLNITSWQHLLSWMRMKENLQTLWLVSLKYTLSAEWQSYYMSTLFPPKPQHLLPHFKTLHSADELISYFSEKGKPSKENIWPAACPTIPWLCPKPNPPLVYQFPTLQQLSTSPHSPLYWITPIISH